MAANVFVSAPAAYEHIRRGALHPRLFRYILIAGLIAIVAGVFASDQMSGLTLRRLFAVFLLYVATVTVLKIVRKTPEFRAEQERVTAPRGYTIGGVMGFAAGLLGIGGGIVTVPLIQTLCRLPLKRCIAVSAATMVITASVGAAIKLSTLGSHGFSAWQGLAIALTLAPTAVLGGYLGAQLTHRLPLVAVRVVFAVLLLIAAWRMASMHA
jgi:hypothetical protein